MMHEIGVDPNTEPDTQNQTIDNFSVVQIEKEQKIYDIILNELIRFDSALSYYF